MISSDRNRLRSRLLGVSRFALPLLAVLLAYSNSFSVPFQFDDFHSVSENPSIRSLGNVPSFFWDPFTQSTLRENVDLRPVLLTTFALNYRVSGTQVWSYHLVTIFLHCVAALLVFVIVRDHLWPGRDGEEGAELRAASTATLFALAPLNSQPVVYVSARSAVLVTVFYLAAFLCCVRNRRWLGGSFLVAALLTKAIALSFPATLIAFDLFYRREGRTVRQWIGDWRRLLALTALPIAICAAYFVYREALLPPGTGANLKQSFTTPWIWIMSQWSAMLWYVRQFVWPDGLTIDAEFGYAFSFWQTRAWLSLAVILGWIALVLAYARRDPLPAFATAWFFLTLAPESTLVPLAEVVNDHRPYIASTLGLAPLAAWILWRAAGLARERRAVAFGVAVALLTLAAVPIIRHRNWVWQDTRRLWLDAASKGPGNGRAWMNAGVAAMASGDLDGAEHDFERARAAYPNYSHIYMNLSVLAGARGDHLRAIAEAERAVALSPNLSGAWAFLGRAREKAGKPIDAEDAYKKALAINARDATAKAGLARLASTGVEGRMTAGLDARYRDGDPIGAIAAFRTVLAENAEHYGATYQLAAALDAAGRGDEARPHWQRTLELAERWKDERVATEVRKRLADADPVDLDTVMRLGLRELYERRRAETASESFRYILGRNPEHYGATYQLATALDELGRKDESRPLWQATLALAERYRDEKTAAHARARIAGDS